MYSASSTVLLLHTVQQPINPFDDQLYTGVLIPLSNISPNEGLPRGTTAVEMLQPNSQDRGIKFIDWDFLHNNAQDAEYQKIKPLI